MARSNRQRYVRQMPKIYGNLQKPKRDFSGFFRTLRNSFWLLVALASAYAVFFSGWFSIRTVTVEGALFAPQGEIQALVPPGKNIWLLSRTGIAAQVMRNPSVESATVLRGLPDHVRIVVHEKKPALLWVSGDSALVLDDAGTAFASFNRANLPSADTALGQALVGVPRVYDVKAVPVRVGQQVSGTSFISFITEVQKQMTSLLPQVAIDHIEVAETTYDVTIYSVQGLKVQVSSLADAGVQIRNLTRLIHQGDASLTSSVDLRVDRWAYVK